jgi:hypothetical protein
MSDSIRAMAEWFVDYANEAKGRALRTSLIEENLYKLVASETVKYRDFLQWASGLPPDIWDRIPENIRHRWIELAGNVKKPSSTEEGKTDWSKLVPVGGGGTSVVERKDYYPEPTAKDAMAAIGRLCHHLSISPTFTKQITGGWIA